MSEHTANIVDLLGQSLNQEERARKIGGEWALTLINKGEIRLVQLARKYTEKLDACRFLGVESREQEEAFCAGDAFLKELLDHAANHSC